MTERRYLSMKDLAEYIGLSFKTLRNWKCTDPGKLPPHVSLPSGGKYDKWRFEVSEVDAWMARNSIGR